MVGDLLPETFLADALSYYKDTLITAYYRLADTGQTTCYALDFQQACGNSAFPGQDGDYIGVPLARSFTGPKPSPPSTPPMLR
jgi:hypothetical protein